MSLAERFAELSATVLPPPGGGHTLERWRALAAVGAEDLALTKLVESHFDAVAILAELGAEDLIEPGQRWAVWAAEPPNARLSVDGSLRGRKAWCSGADLVTHALVTGWTGDDGQQLMAVSLSEPGIQPHSGAWQAVGMGRVRTPDLEFDAVPAVPVGKPGQYVERAGFWHGGCGIAACWYGGTLTLADAVAAKAGGSPNGFVRANLGAIDVELHSLRALLTQTAAEIDRDPSAIRYGEALRVRAAADQVARRVLDEAGRALGAGPLCRDTTVAQHFADLPVFIRQTHAERDLAELAGLVLDRGATWTL